LGSNRTIVGLKQSSATSWIIKLTGSNRTIVGLKLKSANRILSVYEQQSHHCGIETCFGAERIYAKVKAAIAPLWD